MVSGLAFGIHFIKAIEQKINPPHPLQRLVFRQSDIDTISILKGT